MIEPASNIDVHGKNVKYHEAATTQRDCKWENKLQQHKFMLSPDPLHARLRAQSCHGVCVQQCLSDTRRS